MSVLDARVQFTSTKAASISISYTCGSPDVDPVEETSALPAVVAGLLAAFDRRAATTVILDAGARTVAVSDAFDYPEQLELLRAMVQTRG